MTLTVDQLREHALQAVGLGPDGPSDVRAEDVLPHLDSVDRNVRVAALRVLAFCDDGEAVDGVLRGLDDPVKRVREVAAKSSVRFVGDSRVVARLRRAVEDDERGSARPALEILGGMYHSPYGLVALEPVAGALAALADHPRHRQQVLLALLRARTLSDELTALLRTFVRDGTKQEAVYATRRLDGFRVAHHVEVIGDTDARRNADGAWGDVWYWIRVP